MALRGELNGDKWAHNENYSLRELLQNEKASQKVGERAMSQIVTNLQNASSDT